MKKTISTVLLLCTIGFVWAQDFSSLATIALTDADAYKKAEPKVMECCDYLLSNSVKTEAANRQLAIQFIVKWMEGTPEYSFEIDETVMRLTSGSKELLPLYLAAMTKAALTNAVEPKSKADLKKETINLFVDYCGNPDHGVKANKELKQLIAERKGTDV